MRATATFADPCTGARKSTDGSGANSPRGIDHGQSGEAHVPPRWSGHRGRLVAPDESARFWKATPFRAVARVSRYVPLRFTSRDTRRASHDPHEKGTGGDARDHARSASAKATRITRALVRTSHLWRPICWQEQLPATASRFMSCPAHPFRRAAPSLVTRTATSSSRPRSRCAAPSRRRRPAWPQRIKRHHFCKDRRPAGRGGRDRSRPLW